MRWYFNESAIKIDQSYPFDRLTEYKAIIHNIKFTITKLETSTVIMHLDSGCSYGKKLLNSINTIKKIKQTNKKAHSNVTKNIAFLSFSLVKL